MKKLLVSMIGMMIISSTLQADEVKKNTTHEYVYSWVDSSGVKQTATQNILPKNEKWYPTPSFSLRWAALSTFLAGSYEDNCDLLLTIQDSNFSEKKIYEIYQVDGKDQSVTTIDVCLTKIPNGSFKGEVVKSNENKLPIGTEFSLDLYSSNKPLPDDYRVDKNPFHIVIKYKPLGEENVQRKYSYSEVE